MKTEEIVTHLRALSVILHDQGRPEACVITGNAADALEAQAREIERLRTAVARFRGAVAEYPWGSKEAARLWMGRVMDIMDDTAQLVTAEDHDRALATPSTPEETSDDE